MAYTENRIGRPREIEIARILAREPGLANDHAELARQTHRTRGGSRHYLFRLRRDGVITYVQGPWPGTFVHRGTTGGGGGLISVPGPYWDDFLAFADPLTPDATTALCTNCFWVWRGRVEDPCACPRCHSSMGVWVNEDGQSFAHFSAPRPDLQSPLEAVR